MHNEQFQLLLHFFKALADESRLKIVGVLANQDCSVEELAVLLQLKEPTISHHLMKLKELDLVSMRPEGNTHFYRLESENLQNLSKKVFTPEKIASLMEDFDSDVWANRVLQNYIEGEEPVQRLKEIPASRKKRLVILKWLASKFEEQVQYHERSVNEILKRYHPDCATLRRELIASQLMQRENGLYWRR
ncbi:MAG: metalloregulator ArsR/SmtB family transcription factor [Aulosira sp. ZfuVER01]|nr:metalloregulator ArsR/SmtB family transcription factor [Aulosira sp. ZfuVER01]MDZ8002769.1 metalloregulator ArsR/SmtB family transcription factor [Aulosira sp. DedVER01a]MDZ8054413.1 metalloregulator ArsR/SmtB family transcription factor [Aulosira sp. ZfuCHP01]